jgi:hypothetical protein
MLGVMRGAVNNFGAVFCQLRRQVHSGVDDTDSTTDVHIITPLDDFLVNTALASLTFPFSCKPP